MLCFICASCKTQKPYDQMTDEEKIALVVTGEEGLTQEEIDRQHSMRENILNNVHKGNSADEALSKAMANAKEILSETQYARLEAAQKRWLTQGRGRDLNAILKTGKTVQEAYVQSTSDRAETITLQVNQAILIETPGSFQGFYRTTLGHTLEVFELGNEVLVTIRTLDPKLVVTARGKIDTTNAMPNQLIISNDAEPDVSFVLKRLDAETLEATPTERFELSTLKQYSVLLGAQYKRPEKGEFDVFAF